MSPITIYFITGASRGIGLALVNELAARSKDIVVIAGVRNPSNVPQLKKVADKYPGIVETIKYVAADVENNKEIAKYITDKYSYGRVDVVVPNAAIANYNGRVEETPIEQMREHWEVNALSPLILFQQLFPLLKASKNPKFISITSGAGSSAYFDAPLHQTCYGSSKTVVNFITKKIHVENDWITAFPLAPGIIMTDMAYAARKRDKTGMITQLQDEMGVSAEVGGKMLVDIIDASTRASHGGEYINIDGSKLPW